MHIAIDAMGGDHGPGVVVAGSVASVNEWPLTIILVGNESVISHHLASVGVRYPADTIRIVHAPEVIDMGESPMLAYKRKKNSSIHIGLELVKSGQASGFVSAGNTGAVMAASHFILGRIDGVDRPAIASVLPTQTGHVVMLDMGASADCKPHHLAQFGWMGHQFSKAVLGIDYPRVALLNIGEEPEKGNILSQVTYRHMQTAGYQFIGNIESKDILFGKADVVVCDGFVGNNLLKFGEGAAELFFHFFRQEWQNSILSKAGLLLLRPALRRFKRRFDYEEVGGAPLLGVKGVSIIAHGKSNSTAIKNAIQTAFNVAKSDIVSKIGNFTS